MVDRNATKAAIRCGFSEKSAYELGSRLLRKVEVKARIAELQAELNAKALKTAEDWEREVDLIAFFRGHRDFYYPKGHEKEGQLKDVAELTDTQLAIVHEIEHRSFGGGERPLVHVTNLKLYDKLKALEQKGKRLGLFKETQQHEVGKSFEGWLDKVKAHAARQGKK